MSLLIQVGLLTCDLDVVERADSVAERRLHGPQRTPVRNAVSHVHGLVEGSGSSRVDDLVGDRQPTSAGTLWLLCREAIDAGGSAAAVESTDRMTRPGPFVAAVRSAVRAAATGDEDSAHETLAIAAEHGYQPLLVDALEQLAVAAYRSDSLIEAARLLGAAERTRAEISYLWRFPGEHDAIEPIRASASSDDVRVSRAHAEGSTLSAAEAAEYARRARGERGRPHHGWDALTPTELQVVELVANGLTNPEIADRLLMARATVKTHLEHVFVKLGARNRAHVAAEFVRREQ